MDKAKEKTATRLLGLYVPPRLVDELKRLAKSEARSLSAYVRIVLEKHVERHAGRAA